MRKCFCDICEKEVHEIELLNLECESFGSYLCSLDGFFTHIKNKNKKEICSECSENINRIICGLKPEVSADV